MAEANVMELIRKRGAIRQKLTKFSNYLDKVVENGKQLSKEERLQIKRRLENTEPLLKEYDLLTYQISDSNSDSDGEGPCFEDIYYEVVSRAEGLLEAEKQPPSAGEASKGLEVATSANSMPQALGTSRNSAHCDSLSSSESLGSNPNAILKLPALSLPQFDGQPLEWLSFRDAYEAMVHNNSSLSKIYKFYYLKSALIGKAAELIQSLTLTQDNYDTAIAMLYERFDHSRALVFHHIRELMSLDPLAKESASKLRNLIDTLERNLKSLEILMDRDQLLNAILVQLVQTRLDSTTLREFENQFGTDSVPELEDITKFVKRKAVLLETVEQKGSLRPQKTSASNSRSFTAVSSVQCVLCKGTHMLHCCEEYTRLDVKTRLSKVKQLKVCFNCLSRTHGIKSCKSKFSCLKCKRRHHTTLHLDDRQLPIESTKLESNSCGSQSQVNVTAFSSTVGGVLLPTAVVAVYDTLGNAHQVKALLDSGSMSSFVSEGFMQRLGLPQTPVDIQIEGITKSTARIRSSCEIQVQAMNTSYSFKARCLVIPKITSKLPSHTIRTDRWIIPEDINLADPSFYYPSEVNLLLGANYFWDLLLPGKVKLGNDMPILQNSRLGWVISGSMPANASKIKSFLCKGLSERDVNESLQRFWEIENMPDSKPLSVEEQFCEAHFKKTVAKDSQNRFVVSIPFKESPDKLGNSLEHAKQRFYNLERKLSNNSDLRTRYISFMKEYEELNHMTCIGGPDCHGNAFFLPHHGVFKEQNITTKLRVVFDGSARSSNGISLNQLHSVGPIVHSDLLSIILRFRSHVYVFTSDIQSMYRQILVAQDHRRFQRILWRDHPEKPLQAYELNTVTYGTASAPFLATRCIKEVGENCASTHPAVSKVILNSFYVDDCLAGTDNLTQAQELCVTLRRILAENGFPLRKWLSNNAAVLSGISPSDMHPNLHAFGETSKTLGLFWSSDSDELMFRVTQRFSAKVSKRSILSESSQIFDPLGLASPCVMRAKFLLQSLWLSKLSWDDELPTSICEEWSAIRSSFQLLNELRCPRNAFGTSPQRKAKSTSLHGFSDASVKGYGACIYVRSVMDDESIQCNLLIGKGRVAPLKQLSIPKLELLGAVTLAKLVHTTMLALDLKFSEVILWTDSTIVLSWLRLQPNQLNTFVANRVALVQELTGTASWRHVSSKANPSDFISRGIMPTDVDESKRLWLQGPSWLHQPDSTWPNSKFDTTSIPELKPIVTLTTATSEKHFLIPNYSSLTKLKRVVAWCFRFKINCFKPPLDRKVGFLSVAELDTAMKALIRLSQRESFSSELNLLQRQQPIKSSRLLSLKPMLGDDGLLRVGGRITQSSYNYEKKHPSIIDGNHPLAHLMVSTEHIRLLHTGPQQLLFCLRDKYWITSGHKLCKKIYRGCVTCFRNAPQSIVPVMGDLPAYRIQQSHPFQHTGMDFAGPVWVKDRKGRGSKKCKAYICLFICLVTKAIHLELVSNLSTEAFIQCLRRFAARRGFPKHLHSDNGTNFIGARNLLNELQSFLKTSNDSIAKFSSNHGFVWHLSPAFSPHFGGVWEAGVKSSKYHLRRVIGNTPLTFDEFCTVLCQVEAVLNSRPLTPLSSDPADLDPLTPGHFLIGQPLTAVPDEDVSTQAITRVKRYQHLQQMVQHFWLRWSKEYINQLQCRTKWRTFKGALKLNSMVLVKQPNVPPLQWVLGRVVQLHPGKDGVVRVVSVQVATGIIKRSFAAICPLPSQESDE